MRPWSADDRHDAITDRPVPPWELPGHFRMDGAPHRNGLLDAIAFLGVLAHGFSAAAAFLGALPLLLTADVRCPGKPVVALAAASAGLALAGGALCGVARALARRDLAQMSGGLMDPRGRAGARAAEALAAAGVRMTAAPLVLWGLLVLARWLLLPLGD